MLAAARTHVPLVHGDALRLPFADGSLDGATCGFALRNFVALEPFLASLARVVRPGGRIALLEVAEPDNPVLRWGHGIYFGTVVPRIGGLLSDGEAYRYLPRSVAYLPETGAMMGMVRAAGFARREADTAVGRHRATDHGDAGMRAVTRRIDTDVDGRRVGPALRPRARRARPGGARS